LIVCADLTETGQIPYPAIVAAIVMATGATEVAITRKARVIRIEKSLLPWSTCAASFSVPIVDFVAIKGASAIPSSNSVEISKTLIVRSMKC
jgi:hypothetical protein